jgi:hypothetical protein
MMELMSQESPTTNAFSQGFIQWILDDTYVKTIEKPEQDVFAEWALALYMANPTVCPRYHRHLPLRNHYFSYKLVNCKYKWRHNDCEIYDDSNECVLEGPHKFFFKLVSHSLLRNWDPHASRLLYWVSVHCIK